MVVAVVRVVSFQEDHGCNPALGPNCREKTTIKKQIIARNRGILKFDLETF